MRKEAKRKRTGAKKKKKQKEKRNPSTIIFSMGRELLLTSELQRGLAIEDAVYTKSPLGNEGNSLILRRDGTLELYQLIHGQLKLIEIIPIDYRDDDGDLHVSSAFTSYVTNENTTVLVVYYEEPQAFRFLLYNTFLQKFSEEYRVHLQNTKGMPKTLETRPILVTDPQGSFLVLHSFQGFLHSLNIQPNVQNRVETTYIGAITVLHMLFLKNTENDVYLAVVYRDFRFNYSLRYYKLDTDKGSFSLVQQFNDFETQPTGIVAPSSGGLLVFSEIHVFYFPNPNIKLSIPPESYQDKSISINTHVNVLTKLLFSSSDRNKTRDIAGLSSYTVIDENRILAISKSGIAYMIHMNFPQANGSLEVKSFTFLKLNYTTICLQLLYLGSGTFFGVSKLSRSILFTVGPQVPYINVVSEITSSPPVLNLEVDANSNQLFSCQGGYESGEFRNVTKNFTPVRLLRTFIKSSLNSDRLIVSGGSEKFLYLLLSRGTVDGKWHISQNDSSITYKDIQSEGVIDTCGILAISEDGHNVITDSGLFNYKENRIVVPVASFGGRFIDRNTYIQLLRGSNSNEFELLYKDIKSDNVEKIILKGINSQPSEFIDLKVYESYVLVTFSDFYSLLSIDKGSLVRMIDVPIIDVFSTGIEVREGKVWLFFLFGDGKLLQQCVSVCGSLPKLVPYKSLYSQFGNYSPCKIATGPNEVVLYNKESVEVYGYNPITKFYENSQLPKKMKNLKFLCHLKDNYFVYLRDDDGIGFIEIENTSKIGSTLTSNLLYLKSIRIPNTNLSVVLGFDFKYSESLGEIVKSPFVNLIDNSTMKEVKKILLNDCKDVVDICLSLDDDYTFIILDNSGDSTPLHTYRIRLETEDLDRIQDTTIDGLENHSISYQSIKHITNGLYLISGSKIFIVQGTSGKFTQIWRRSSQIIQQSVFTSASTLMGSEIAVLDILKGCQMIRIIDDGALYQEDEHLLPELKLELPLEVERSSFEDLCTSLAITSYQTDLTERYRLFIGNSKGLIFEREIPIKPSQSDDSFSSLSLGSQINVIEAIRFKDVSQFEKNFSKRIELEDDIEVDLTPQALVGTANGGIYMLSYATGEIVPILEQCYQELIQAQKGTDPKKKRKSRRRMLEPEESTEENLEISGRKSFSVNLFYRYLLKVHEEGEDEKRFPHCVKNSTLLQRVVFETSALRSRNG